MIAVNRRRVMGGGNIVIPVAEDYGYFATMAIEDTAFTLTMLSGILNDVTSISYSLDMGTTWTSFSKADLQTDRVITTPTISKGNYVLWKGVCKRLSNTTNNGSIFSSSGLFSVSGNPFSLIYGDDYASATADKDWFTFTYMLYRSKVYSATNLKINMASVKPGAYYYMFRECADLVLPPKEISCTSFTEGDRGQFEGMFYDCGSLGESPVINVPTLPKNALKVAFQYCTNIKKVTLLATDISHSNCLQDWLANVCASGTIIKRSTVTLSSGASGVPTGWATQDYVEQ